MLAVAIWVSMRQNPGVPVTMQLRSLDARDRYRSIADFDSRGILAGIQSRLVMPTLVFASARGALLSCPSAVEPRRPAGGQMPLWRASRARARARVKRRKTTYSEDMA